jgi:predicted Fe-Mo cluster-binding NifX family protein
MQAMKIAIVSDDHQTISAHFGRATYYEVFTLEDGKVIARETRQKSGHSQFANEPHDEPGYPHGRGPAAEGRHGRMVGIILDCQALIARGMGQGAFDNLKSNGIQPILTDVSEIEKAVETYLKGQLADHPDRLH